MKKLKNFILIFIITSLSYSNFASSGGNAGGDGGDKCTESFSENFYLAMEAFEKSGLELPSGLSSQQLIDKFQYVNIVPVDHIENCEKTGKTIRTACARVSENVIELNCNENSPESWQSLLGSKMSRILPLHEILWFDQGTNDSKYYYSSKAIELAPITYAPSFWRGTVELHPKGGILIRGKLKLKGRSPLFVKEESIIGLCKLFNYQNGHVTSSYKPLYDDVIVIGDDGQEITISTDQVRNRVNAIMRAQCF